MSELGVFAASALGLILVVSSVSKLRDPSRFRDALKSHRLFPNALVGLLVVAVPVAELVLAAGQWWPDLQPFVGLALAATLGAFTAVSLRALITGVRADCGCFGGSGPHEVTWFSIVRNAVLIGLASIAAFAQGDAGESLVPAALSGLGAGLLILVLDQASALLTGGGPGGSARRAPRSRPVGRT